MKSRALAEAFSLVAAAVAAVWISREVGPANLGYYAIAVVVLQLGVILVNAGLPPVGSQRVASRPEEQGAAWRLLVLSRLVTGVALMVVTELALLILPIDPALAGLLAMVALGWLVVPLSSEWLLIATGKVRSLSVSRLLGSLAGLAAAIALIRGPNDAVLLPLVAIGPLAVSAASSMILSRGWRTTSRAADELVVSISEYARDARHVLKGELATFILFSSDRLFLYAYTTPTTVGLYEAAYRLIQPFYAVASIVNDVMFVPLAAWLKDRRDAIFRHYVDAMSVATIPLGPFCLGHAWLVIELVYGPDYRAAGLFLAVLGWVITFGYTSGILVVPLIPWAKQREYGNAILAGSGTSLALNAVLIPATGGLGAALATVGAKVVVTVIGVRYFRGISHYPILRHYGVYLAMSGIALAVSQVPSRLLGLSELAGALAFVLIYLALFGIWRGVQNARGARRDVLPKP